MSGRAARKAKARKRDTWSLHWTGLMLEWNAAWDQANERPSIRWPMLPVTMTVTTIDRVNGTITVSV